MIVKALLKEPWRERLIAALGLAGAVLLVMLALKAPSRRPGPIRLDISVVPRDVNDLGCASDVAMERQRCAFDARGRPGDVARPLRPHVTISDELVLISGVFEAPEVARWLESSPRSKKRVTLRCRGTLLGRAASVGIRKRRTESFRTKRDVAVVTVTECRVRD
jgi:hypothetical protein